MRSEKKPSVSGAMSRSCRDLAAARPTIVLVERNLAATLALAQRVYIFNNRHMVHEGPAEEIKAQPQIFAAQCPLVRSVRVGQALGKQQSESHTHSA